MADKFKQVNVDCLTSLCLILLEMCNLMCKNSTRWMLSNLAFVVLLLKVIMAQRIGIAVDLEVRKWELEQEYKNTRNWKWTAPFENIDDAVKWEKETSLEKKVKTVPHQKLPKTSPHKQKWCGFIFDHDGPK